MILVFGSSIMISPTSGTETSHSLPMETIFEKASPRCWPRETKVPVKLPLWLMTPILPLWIFGICIMRLGEMIAGGSMQ